MDWFSWLSKTNLDPTLVYEYGVAFAQNELEQDDISYLNHEFLQSMGISIAKHRLEILKLARKQTGSVPKLLIAIKRCFSRYLLRALTRRQESAMAIVPRKSYSARWKKNSRAPLLLTNGGSGAPMVFRSSRINSFSSPFVYDDDVDEYWSSAVEEIRWDTMFQNLKPT